MSSNHKIIGSVVGFATLLLVGSIAYSWISDSSIREVASLQKQLLTADDLSKEQFNALKLDLMRTVDTMPREKVREMYEKLAREKREAQEENTKLFFAANEKEKEILLDQVIKQKQRSREIERAMRTDGAFTRRKPSKERLEMMEAAKKIKQSMDAGDITEEQGREQFMALREKSNRRPEPTEEERSAREEQRRRQDDFNQALAVRAKRIGVELPAERGRGGRRGRQGGG